MPTSLLAQVDSARSAARPASIHAHGKNLVGAFHQPDLVLADTDALDTLPAREFRAGYAEIAKAGLIGDAAFFEWLEKNRRGDLRRRRRRARARSRERRVKARSSPPTNARPATRAAQSRPYVRPRDRGGERLRREPACPRRRRSRSAWCWRTISQPAKVSRRSADAERARKHLKGAGLPVSLADMSGD